MFNKLGSFKDIFRRDNWSHSNTGRVGEMLDLCVAMNKFTYRVLFEGHSDSKVQKKLYERDQRVNELQQEVRRSVVIHMAMADNPEDVPSAMIYMNVVKDAERIGDYVKNLYDVASELMPEDADLEIYKTHLSAHADAVRDCMIQTGEAFTESDEDLANGVIATARKESQALEEAIVAIAHGDLPTRDSVPLVLVLRFYKRILMHLSNIATTVVMPIDKMDFHDERTQP